MDKLTIEVRLNSDTGHHFYFIPVWAESRLTAEKRELAGLAKDFPPNCNRAGLLTSLRENIPTHWTIGATGYEWLKIRRSSQVKFSGAHKNKLGSEPFDLEGLWLCIETNTGRKEKGVVYSEETNVGLERVEDANASPRRYVAMEPNDLDASMTLQLSDIYPDFEKLSREQSLPSYEIKIIWNQYQEEHEVPVRLVVDYGNSRTVAAVLDNASRAAGEDTQLSMITAAIDLNNELQDARGFLTGESRTRYDSYIADSWMVLRRPIFESENSQDDSEQVRVGGIEFEESTKLKNFLKKIGFGSSKLEVKNTAIRKIQPYMFRELGIATIGNPAYDLVGERLVDDHVRYFLSAPKRYCWDQDPPNTGGGTQWYMIDQTSSRVGVISLDGEVLKYLPEDFGSRYLAQPMDLSRNPADVRYSTVSGLGGGGFSGPRSNNYPRADAMVWSAHRIIELAYRQVQSENNWRGRAVHRRRLTEVVLTYPSGWTYLEKRAFLDAWRSAANIFFWSRFDDSSKSLNVRLGLDEAVASQLPVVFADIVNLGNSVERWLELYGKEREGTQTCRILTIDIGGGTTDISVVEYTGDSTGEGATPAISPKVLMTDSTFHAGDRLVQSLTNEILIPSLCEGHSEDDLDVVYRVLRGSDQSPVEATKRAVLNRTVFLPMVISWLKRMSTDTRSATTGGVVSVTAGSAGCHLERLADLNNSMLDGGLSSEFWPLARRFDVNIADIRKVIKSWLDPLIVNGTFYLGGLDCDFVVVTGKPSEIETVKAEMRERLPIDPSRIVFAKGFYAGKYVPLTQEDGRTKQIADAKLVTVTGAIIREASSIDRYEKSEHGAGTLLNNLKIEPAVHDEEFVQNYWHRDLPSSGSNDASCVMRPGDNGFKLMHGSAGSVTFSRSKFKNGPREPVYELRQRATDNARNVNKPIAFHFERKMHAIEDEFDAEGYTAEERDYLSIQQTGERLTTEELRLVDVQGVYADGSPADIDEWQLRVRTMDKEHWLDNPRFQRQG